MDLNMGMTGGTSVNSIPFAAWMEVDLRSVDPVRLAGIDGQCDDRFDERFQVHSIIPAEKPGAQYSNEYHPANGA